jgi:mono/diheme cytochrome c family protein
MFRLMVAAIACALVLKAAALPAAALDEAEKGRELAEALCAGCHLNEGQGEKQGPMGIPGFGAIANRHGQSLEGIVTWLQSAPPMMPDHKLTQDEIFALADYIMSLREGP